MVLFVVFVVCDLIWWFGFDFCVVFVDLSVSFAYLFNWLGL